MLMYLLNTLHNYYSEKRYVKNRINSGTGPDSILEVVQSMEFDYFNREKLKFMTYVKSNLLFFKVEILKYSCTGYTFEDSMTAQMKIISVLKKSIFVKFKHIMLCKT